MRLHGMVALVTAILPLGCAQPPATLSFTAWAKSKAIPVARLSMDGALDDLRPLRDAIGSARVVEYGEPAHGAREPLEFRNRLFRYLVEELGFTAIALESSLSQSRRLYDFVQEASADVDDDTRNGFSFGFGEFKANEDLLRWIHAYNADPTHRRKVHIYGMDIDQLGVDTLAISQALGYLQRVDSAAAKELGARLHPFLERATGPTETTAAEQAELTAAIDELYSALAADRPDFTAATSALDFEWALRDVVVAQQSSRFLNALPPAFKALNRKLVLGQKVELVFPAPAEMSLRRGVRDAAMAENASWALAQEGHDGRLFVFAHNAHIMNAVQTGGWWKNLKPQTAMGRHLRAIFGRDLVIVGTSSAQNGPGVQVLDGVSPADAKVGSVDSAMVSVGLPAFLLDLRSAPPSIAQWLSQRQTIRANITTELELAPSQAFDLLFFVQTLTGAPTVQH